MTNSPFLYQYPDPLPPLYPHPVSKGGMGGDLAGNYWANRGFWRLPLWQTEFGPSIQHRPDVTGAKRYTQGRSDLRGLLLLGCCGFLKANPR